MLGKLITFNCHSNLKLLMRYFYCYYIFFFMKNLFVPLCMTDTEKNNNKNWSHLIFVIVLHPDQCTRYVRSSFLCWQKKIKTKNRGANSEQVGSFADPLTDFSHFVIISFGRSFDRRKYFFLCQFYNINSSCLVEPLRAATKILLCYKIRVAVVSSGFVTEVRIFFLFPVQL